MPSTKSDGRCIPAQSKEAAFRDAEWVNRLEPNADMRWNLPLVAELDGAPIGLAWGRIDKQDTKYAHIFQVWIAPAHRARGAGRLLIDAIITWATSLGAQHIGLDVTCGDTSAMRLYSRAGFVVSGSEEPLRPGSDVMVQPMRLTLRQCGDG